MVYEQSEISEKLGKMESLLLGLRSKIHHFLYLDVLRNLPQVLLNK